MNKQTSHRARKPGLKISVADVQITKTKVQAVRFKVLPKKQKVRATSLHQPPLFVERLGRKKFLAAPRNELPVLGSTPAEAFSKAVNRHWH